MTGSRVLSPVLLVGAGPGEATCGILYLAGYLRRHGVEAFVRLCDDDDSDEDAGRSVAALVAHLRPRVVGISLKWFHHVHRARVIAKAVRAIDPAVRIVLGGNTASFFWRELLAWDCVNDVVLGDGEAPLLALCRGAPPLNSATRAADGAPQRTPFGYVQDASANDVHYSHFDELFLSRLDQSGFSGWVAPGKGCGESCVYCGGRRAAQRLSFGRADPFLRPEASVRRDHRELASKVWQFRYDFPGGKAAYLGRVWEGFDLSRHSTTYFLWGVPPKALIDTLARTFARVYLVLDIGCFSELQRTELMGRGLLKPCPTDRELFAAIDHCRSHDNLELEVAGIAGLPFTSTRALEQERRAVERVLGRGCDVGYQRLQAQPGALVTEHPDRFEMVSDAQKFDDYLAWFAQQSAFPMVRFADAALERAVQRNTDQIYALIDQAAPPEIISGTTRLEATIAAKYDVELGDWLGEHRSPRRAAHEPVTVIRAVDGAGLACAPSLEPDVFSHPALQEGATGAAILATLASFAQPTTLDAALPRVCAGTGLDAGSAREVVDQLAAGRFLQPA